MEQTTVQLDNAVPHTLCLDDTQRFVDLLAESETLRRMHSLTNSEDEPSVGHEQGLCLDDDEKSSTEVLGEARIYPSTQSGRVWYPSLSEDAVQAFVATTHEYSKVALRKTLQFTVVALYHSDRYSEKIIRGTVAQIKRFANAVARVYEEAAASYHPAHEDVRPLNNTEDAVRVKAYAPSPVSLPVVNLDTVRSLALSVLNKRSIPVKAVSCASVPVSIRTTQTQSTDRVTIGCVVKVLTAMLVDGHTANIDRRV